MLTRRRALILAALAAAGCGGGGSNPASFAPKTTVVAGSASAGATDGPLETATFRNPVNVAVDTDGTVYVCDFDNGRIRTIKGNTVATLVNQANFDRPFGITIAPDGTLYVQTDANDLGARDGTTGTVWRVDKITGLASVVARNLGRPRGLCALADGRIAFSDLTGNDIGILTPSTGVVTDLAGLQGNPGFANGTGTEARFERPYGLTQLSDGSLLVADQTNNRIRRVTLAGVVTTFAGSGVAGSTTGPVATAEINGPQDVKVAPNGRIYVADTVGHYIREIRGGQVRAFAGNGREGFQEGTGEMASFFGLEGIAVSPDGKSLYVADGTGGGDGPFNRVRRFGL